MFGYFSQHCKTDVYDARKIHEIDIVDIIILVTYIMEGTILICSLYYQWKHSLQMETGIVIIGIIMITELIYKMCRDNYKWKKQSMNNKNQHQEEIINKIIAIMKSEAWEIYNPEGIQWVLK